MNTKSEISNQKRVADIRPQNLHWGGCFIGKSASLHSQPMRRRLRRAVFSQYWKSAANLNVLLAALWEQNSQDGCVAPRKKPKSRQRRYFGSILGFWRRQKTFRLQTRLASRKPVAASTTKSVKRFTLMLHGQTDRIKNIELSESWSHSEMSREMFQQNCLPIPKTLETHWNTAKLDCNAEFIYSEFLTFDASCWSWNPSFGVAWWPYVALLNVGLTVISCPVPCLKGRRPFRLRSMAATEADGQSYGEAHFSPWSDPYHWPSLAHECPYHWSFSGLWPTCKHGDIAETNKRIMTIAQPKQNSWDLTWINWDFHMVR